MAALRATEIETVKYQGLDSMLLNEVQSCVPEVLLQLGYPQADTHLRRGRRGLVDHDFEQDRSIPEFPLSP
jgi:hypothetical protein